MGFIAVVGSGSLGGAIARSLALRDRVAEVRLVDPHGGVAQGKALDIVQAAPIEGFSARIVAAHSLHSAAGARAVVLADSAADGVEHAGEAALAMVRQLAAIEASAPFVFAGADQRELMARVFDEVHVRRHRMLGTAPGALESALRALTGVAIDGSGVEVQLRIVGVPPGHVAVGWEEASAFGLPLRSLLPPHSIAGLTARIPQLWPPGPYTLASAAATVIEAIASGSRKRFSCFVVLDSGARRNAVAAMPVEVGPAGVIRVIEPSLTRQEQTLMENALER
jgi:malate dehydrogenase